MLFKGQVGPQILQDGASETFRQGKSGEMVVSELSPAYAEQVLRGNVFFGSHQAAATFSANGLTSVSAVGLCLYNPPTSGKNIIPLQCELVMTNLVTTSTDVQAVVAVSALSSALVPATGGALVAYRAFGPASVSSSIAILCTTLTFANNPVIYKPIYSAFITTTIAAAIPTPSVAPPYDFKGALILSPGTGLAIVASNASTGFASINWMELNP